MPYRKIIIIPLILFHISGCEQKKQFLKETMKNMVYVKGGTFEMGDFCVKEYGTYCALSNNNASLPVHSVTLDSFYMAKYKVTYSEYDHFTNDQSLPKLKIDQTWLKKYPSLRGDDYPATANWQLSMDYCQWLAKKTSLPFNLPTEAQWEYAARNRGQDTQYGTNDGHFRVGINVPSYEQEKGYSGYYAGLYPVGKFPASPLGIFDMAGNGQEWMFDWFSDTFYQHSPAHNPTGPQLGIEKVLRGMPLGDSRKDDATPTATTMFRTGKEPLLRIFPVDVLIKYNGDIRKASESEPKIDPYKVAEQGFFPNITFRCVINAQSLPEKYR